LLSQVAVIVNAAKDLSLPLPLVLVLVPVEAGLAAPSRDPADFAFAFAVALRVMAFRHDIKTGAKRRTSKSREFSCSEGSRTPLTLPLLALACNVRPDTTHYP
jgi:hypothetical protein